MRERKVVDDIALNIDLFPFEDISFSQHDDFQLIIFILFPLFWLFVWSAGGAAELCK